MKKFKLFNLLSSLPLLSSVTLFISSCSSDEDKFAKNFFTNVPDHINLSPEIIVASNSYGYYWKEQEFKLHEEYDEMAVKYSNTDVYNIHTYSIPSKQPSAGDFVGFDLFKLTLYSTDRSSASKYCFFSEMISKDPITLKLIINNKQTGKIEISCSKTITIY